MQELDKEMVKFIRKMTGLTQVEFAERLGYTSVYFSMIETGARNVSKEVEGRIMREFELSKAEIATYRQLMNKMKQ